MKKIFLMVFMMMTINTFAQKIQVAVLKYKGKVL